MTLVKICKPFVGIFESKTVCVIWLNIPLTKHRKQCVNMLSNVFFVNNIL